MKTKIVIGLLCVATVLVWTGMAGAQIVTPGPKMQTPSGEELWRLEGLWKAVLENYGEWERFGTYPNMYLIKQTGNAFSAVRMQDNPPPSPGKTGSPSLFGELEKNGFKSIYIIDSSGKPWPSKGQISEDGNKVTIEEGTKARAILTRFPGM
jgi:hypothetical protein